MVAHKEKPVGIAVSRKVLFALLSVVALGGVLFLVMPGNMQYELKDALKRPFTPNFDFPPNEMKSARQDEWIAEYRRRGYELTCYGNLRPEEQLSKDDDFNCWGIIKSAYDNIPARMIVFWFHKGELQHIKIEFPESSFTPLQDYLGRHFSGVTRLDQSASAAFGTDIYGKPLMVWRTKHGVVVASNTPTPGQPLTLLWISNEKLLRDVLAGLLSRVAAGVKPSIPQLSAASAVPQSASIMPPVSATEPAKPMPAAPVHIYQIPHATKAAVITETKILLPRKNKPSDLRYCLELQSNYAIAECANKSR